MVCREFGKGGIESAMTRKGFVGGLAAIFIAPMAQMFRLAMPILTPLASWKRQLSILNTTTHAHSKYLALGMEEIMPPKHPTTF